MSARVVKFADLQAARASRVDTRTQTQRLIDEERAAIRKEAHLEGFYKGLYANLESVGAPMVDVLRPRLSVVTAQAGGWAS